MGFLCLLYSIFVLVYKSVHHVNHDGLSQFMIDITCGLRRITSFVFNKDVVIPLLRVIMSSHALPLSFDEGFSLNEVRVF